MDGSMARPFFCVFECEVQVSHPPSCYKLNFSGSFGSCVTGGDIPFLVIPFVVQVDAV